MISNCSSPSKIALPMTMASAQTVMRPTLASTWTAVKILSEGNGSWMAHLNMTLLPENTTNEVVFGSGVRLSILGKLALQVLLQFGILGTESRVGTKPIAKP